MSNILVINASGPETRVALVENGSISEFYLERKKDKGIVGNVYKGKVVRVLPGMQAAFVDIGLEKAAFLYVGDVAGGPDFSEEFDIADTPEGEHVPAPEGEVPAEDAAVAADKEAVAAIAAKPSVDVEDAANPQAPVAVDALASDESSEEATADDETAPVAEEDSSSSESVDERLVEMSADEVADAETEAPRDDATGESSADGDVDEALEDDENGDDEDEDEVHEYDEDDQEDQDDQDDEATDVEAAADEEASVVESDADVQPPSKKKARPRRAREKAEKAQKKQTALEPLAHRKRREGPVDKASQDLAKAGRGAQIQDLLKEGQEVIVQVVKDPIGTKGARVTCHISLPGRHLVFMPTVDHVGISRRIDQDRERRRLRELVDGLRPPGTGFIVRTVADGVSKEKLVADIRFLLGIWNDMANKKDRLRAPALLHPDLDLILRSIRDLFSSEVEKLVIDDPAEYERIVQFVSQSVPHLESAIELYRGKEPIFDAYGIEQELQRALSRKVWLKSGGYLIIDQAEALVAIDINSGKFVGKKNLEETITQINIEAAKEIVYQLRLRNIGGIIIIDFIDMEKQPNREKVFKALQVALQKDRAKTNIVKISELGLVEMTRKRVRESVGQLLHESCVACDGRGFIKSKTTIAYEIFRELQRDSVSHREDTLVVSCNPDVAKHITQEERETLRHLMMRFNKTVQVKALPAYHQEQFDISFRWSKRDEPKAARASAGQKKGPAQKQESTPEQATVLAVQPKDEERNEGAAADGGAKDESGQPASRRRRRRRRRPGGAARNEQTGEGAAHSSTPSGNGEGGN